MVNRQKNEPRKARGRGRSQARGKDTRRGAGRRGRPPTGRPIPPSGVVLLRDMPMGCRGRIKRLTCRGQLRRRLMDMGVVPGTEVEVERPAPLGDPLKIKLKGFNLSLRKDEAGQIEVEVEEEEEDSEG